MLTTPPSPPNAPPNASATLRTSAAPELRRYLLQMVVAVVVLDVGALVLKSRLGVDGWPEQRRLLFTAVWMIATLAIVTTALARIRVARTRAQRARAAQSRSPQGRSPQGR